MKQLNERHTWFNLDKNEEYILRYTTKDGSMLTDEVIENILTDSNNKVVMHRYGVIVFKEQLTSIGYNAFDGCRGLNAVIIPNSVTSIGDYAFYECSDLTSITIPNSVTSIGSNAFEKCSKLSSITIPNSVTFIGYGAFSDCSVLTSISVEKGNTFYDSRNDCNAIIETFSDTLIQGCKNTIIPNSVTSIGDCAFINCTDLTSITIPNRVSSIGNYAFEYCSGLTSLTIPNSVISIGWNAFYGCSVLTNITYKGTTIGFKKIELGTNVFNKGVKIHCTDGIITI